MPGWQRIRRTAYIQVAVQSWEDGSVRTRVWTDRHADAHGAAMSTRGGAKAATVAAQDILAGDINQDADWIALMDAAPNSEGHISVLIQFTTDSTTQLRTWWDPTTTLTVYR